MVFRSLYSSATLLCSVVLSACSSSGTEPAATGNGTIELHVATTGTDVDPDGYSVSVDGGADQALAANATVSWSGEAGSHAVAITGLAFNCDLTTNPTTAAVAPGETTHIDAHVTCAPYLRNVIIYSSQAFGLPEVMIMRPDGSRSQRLTTNQWVYVNPAASPDGQTIAVETQAGTGSRTGIYLLDRFGKGPTKFPGHGPDDVAPAWSPNGTMLAFGSTVRGVRGNAGRIFVANRDGTGVRQVSPETVDYTYDTWPAWSPDGTRIAYSHTGVLTVINVDGTGERSLGINGNYPAWSPDGAHIAYVGLVNGIQAIFIADPNGANVRQLTTPAQGDQSPEWSPDGTQIVFTRTEGTVTRLYKMTADGTGQTRLTAGTQSEYGARWTPTF
jgi:TolB protein